MNTESSYYRALFLYAYSNVDINHKGVSFVRPMLIKCL